VREAFEAWASSEGMMISTFSDDETYVGPIASISWRAWQAALAHASSARGEECSVDAKDAITLMRFIFRHFGDVSMSHHLTDDVVQATRRIESVAGTRGLSSLNTKPIGWYDILRVGTNSGHGHAWARPDGMKARCGGPALCAQCAREQAIAGRRGEAT